MTLPRIGTADSHLPCPIYCQNGAPTYAQRVPIGRKTYVMTSDGTWWRVVTWGGVYLSFRLHRDEEFLGATGRPRLAMINGRLEIVGRTDAIGIE